jgi:hypothetical protein
MNAGLKMVLIKTMKTIILLKNVNFVIGSFVKNICKGKSVVHQSHIF